MELSERERADLATFFAKRFPSFEERAALCEAVGLAARVQLAGEAHAVWADIVRVAAEEARLLALAARAQRRAPEDENLAEMVRVLREGRGRRGPWLWLGAGGLGVVAAAGLLLWAPWAGAPSTLESVAVPAANGPVAPAPAAPVPVEPVPAVPAP
ncbi:MAG: effector-associated domain EAD1-containing protein, partial [Pseudomonadota bacterium]